MELGGFAAERRAGIAEYARDAGWVLENRLIAFLAQGRHEEYLASFEIDGIISMLHSGKDQPFRDALYKLVASARVPVVDLWHDYPRLEVPRVHLDHRAAGRLAAEHLLDLGMKRLLFYSHAVDRRVANVRRDGFQETAAARGVAIEELCWGSETPIPKKLGRVGWLAARLLASELPLGVMAANDMVASDLLDAADHAGLRVPEDIAVIGVDNDPILTELGLVPLTSVEVDKQRVGYEAAALLDRMLGGAAPPKQPMLIPPAGVVTRRSTEVLAVSDPEVVRAVRFIQEHFREPISVANAAAETFLSRRRLQDRFRAALGHGISEEITRQRIQFAQHLLTQTEHKIGTVARMAGFSSVHRMSKVFRRNLVTTPQAYRDSHRPAIGARLIDGAGSQ
jgi:LacI family transcriptional regulator